MQALPLTPTSFIVLGLLHAAGEATPYELKQLAASRLGHFWSVAHSQLYSEPERLVRAGYLFEEQEATGRRRRRYALTDAGRQAFREWLATPALGGYELRDPGLLQLALGAEPTRLAEAQLEAHGRTLDAYETLLERLEAAGAGDDPRILVLRAGVGHEREYLRFWREVSAKR